MACSSKTFTNYHLLDTLNQVPIESKALGGQVFTAVEYLVEIRTIRLVTSKRAGEPGKTVRGAHGF